MSIQEEIFGKLQDFCNVLEPLRRNCKQLDDEVTAWKDEIGHTGYGPLISDYEFDKLYEKQEENVIHFLVSHCTMGINVDLDREKVQKQYRQDNPGKMINLQFIEDYIRENFLPDVESLSLEQLFDKARSVLITSGWPKDGHSWTHWKVEDHLTKDRIKGGTHFGILNYDWYRTNRFHEGLNAIHRLMEYYNTEGVDISTIAGIETPYKGDYNKADSGILDVHKYENSPITKTKLFKNGRLDIFFKDMKKAIPVLRKIYESEPRRDY